MVSTESVLIAGKVLSSGYQISLKSHLLFFFFLRQWELCVLEVFFAYLKPPSYEIAYRVFLDFFFFLMEFTGLAFMDAWIFQPQNLWSSWSFLRRLTQVCFTELGIGFASWKDFVSLLIMLESHSFWLWIEASHPLTGCLTCCEECGECLITDKKKFKTIYSIIVDYYNKIISKFWCSNKLCKFGL